MNKMMAKVKKAMCIMAAAGLCLGLLTGCGDGIKKKTSETVITKTDTALQLYADIEKMVQDNALMADENFTAMKSKLTEMSAKIKKQITDTTEEDGQMTLKELDAMIQNLTEVKDQVQKKIDGTAQ